MLVSSNCAQSELLRKAGATTRSSSNHLKFYLYAARVSLLPVSLGKPSSSPGSRYVPEGFAWRVLSPEMMLDLSIASVSSRSIRKLANVELAIIKLSYPIVHQCQPLCHQSDLRPVHRRPEHRLVCPYFLKHTNSRSSLHRWHPRWCISTTLFWMG